MRWCCFNSLGQLEPQLKVFRDKSEMWRALFQIFLVTAQLLSQLKMAGILW